MGVDYAPQMVVLQMVKQIWMPKQTKWEASGKVIAMVRAHCSSPVTLYSGFCTISKKAQRIKGLIRPYISQKAIKLLKCIIMIIWAYSGPHFNPKAI